MGVLDFLKRDKTDKMGSLQKSSLVDKNTYLLNTLKDRLIALGYNVKRHPEYMSLRLNDDIEIATVIVETPAHHAALLQLMILTSQSKYIPDGIYECIVGIGHSPEDQITSVLDNYLNTTFAPIMEGFTESHNPILDFSTVIDNKATLWHPKLGRIGYQGEWTKYPEGEPLFDLLKEKISGKLTQNKFNWLKVYTSKSRNGTLVSECNFNNVPWEEGQKIINTYAESWAMDSEFCGMKQFMMFRRCDGSDN